MHKTLGKLDTHKLTFKTNHLYIATRRPCHQHFHVALAMLHWHMWGPHYTWTSAKAPRLILIHGHTWTSRGSWLITARHVMGPPLDPFSFFRERGPRIQQEPSEACWLDCCISGTEKEGIARRKRSKCRGTFAGLSRRSNHLFVESNCCIVFFLFFFSALFAFAQFRRR